MPDEKSKIRKCPTCGEWNPVDQAGCVHCDRAKGNTAPKGFSSPSQSSGKPSGSGQSGLMGSIAGVLALAVVGLSQCTGKSSHESPPAASSAASSSPISDDDPIAILSAAEVNLKANLKDPESAKFRGLFVSKLDSGPYALCGKVNSKNSFGGYTGFVRFIASVNPDAPTIIEGNPTGFGEAVDKKIFPAAYAKFCSNVVKRFDAIKK